MAAMGFGSVTNPQLITIQGNMNDPGAVVLVCSNCGSGQPMLVFADHQTDGVTLRSFTLSATQDSEGYGIGVYGGIVWADRIIAQSFGIGFLCDHGILTLTAAKTVNCLVGVVAQIGGEAIVLGANLYGMNLGPGHNGLLAQTGGKISGGTVAIYDFYGGVVCDATSSIPATGVQFQNVAAQYNCAIHG